MSVHDCNALVKPGIIYPVENIRHPQSGTVVVVQPEERTKGSLIALIVPACGMITTLGTYFQAPCSHFSGTGKLWQTLGNSAMIQEPCRQNQNQILLSCSLKINSENLILK